MADIPASAYSALMKLRVTPGGVGGTVVGSVRQWREYICEMAFKSRSVYAFSRVSGKIDKLGITLSPQYKFNKFPSNFVWLTSDSQQGIKFLVRGGAAEFVRDAHWYRSHCCRFVTVNTSVIQAIR